MNLRRMRTVSIAALLLIGCQNAGATSIDQYASTVIDYSSQWSAGSWSAAQALGAPDTFGYGDIPTSWAPAPKNGGNQHISVGFATAVYSDGVTIRETYGNGFVYQIDVIDLSDALHTVWSGTDNSLPGAPVDFLASWSQTGYLIDGLKIYVDTEHNQNAWEEIDSIQLHGSSEVTSAIPEPVTIALFGLGLAGMGLSRKTASPA